MNLEQEALEVTAFLKEQYFAKRDMDAVLQCMDRNVSWIGTGEADLNRDLEAAKQSLSMESPEYGGSFSVLEEWIESMPISDSVCVVYGIVWLESEDSNLADELLRFSLIFKAEEETAKLVHMHFSHADYGQENGSYFMPKSAEADNQTLRQALDARGRLLDNLMKNAPAGVHQCVNDADFTLLSMSDGFLTMFGYTREEIDTIFDGKYINMIYPDDRAQMLRSCCNQLEKGPDVVLEYRVLCKSGPPVWVLDRGRLQDDGTGYTYFYCILIEIGQHKRQQEELRLSLERHQVIMDQTTDIIFEWDIRRDTLQFSGNWRKKFGYDPICQDISHNIPLSSNIYADDMPAFMKIMKDTAQGVPYSETEFRIRDSSDQYLWCRVRATAQFDEDMHPIKAVGVIIDIDSEKKQKERLMEQAQRDALTGLYNKAATDMLVEQRMTCGDTESNQALMIIDVDHFKAVNDNYGHLSGDSLLSDIAGALRNNTRSTDFIGRVGGDEFLVYLPEITDWQAALRKSNIILAALEVLKPDENAVPITCSIGVAFYRRGTKDYHTMYKCADLALYYQKNNGRGGIAFYDEELYGNKDHCDVPSSAVSASIVSDESNVVDEQLAQYAFRALYEAADIGAALNRLLEIIGRSYDVSRVYIFESSENGRNSSMTFEWCSEDVPPQLEVLQDYSYEDDLGNYQDNFDRDGIFYCRSIDQVGPELYAVLASQGIHSMLQCAITDDGVFRGGVGFDECRKNHSWSNRQVATFKLTAEVLASFVLKLRYKQKLAELMSEL